MNNLIPILYVFNFKPEHIVNAIKRLNCSLTSMLPQADKIYILNASQENIDIIDNDKMIYIFKPYHGYFNKAVLINYVVKNYFQEYSYFVHSDIDLIYSQDYIKRMKSYTIDKPVRVMPRNIAMPMEYYSSNYNDLKIIADKFKQHPSGEGRGIGLIHIKSFINIQGYNEKFLGYGQEDLELNKRLEKYKNEIIYDKGISEIHLWHLPFNREYLKYNNQIWYDSLRKIENNDIIRNNSDWGNY
jgi:predicted glycosyltransferase involved in capsule biosynthesis